MVKICTVLAPKERASAIFARSTLLKPVAELIITIGPLASATAMMRGSLPKPNRRMSSGTSASIGVVTSSKMYGVTTFSTKGNWVMTAAMTKPIAPPIAKPTKSS